MLVSYTYRSDDAEGGDLGVHPSKPEIRRFEFYTVVDLGPIISREEARMDL
jgi:dynactin-4